MPGECQEAITLGGITYNCSTCKNWTRGLGASDQDLDVWGECSQIYARNFEFSKDEAFFTKEDDQCEYLDARKDGSGSGI